MKLDEIIINGFVSYYGDELDDVSIAAFRTEKKADAAFRRSSKMFSGSDSGVLHTTTQNGYFLVGEMDWREMDAFANAHFIAFAPTLTSCQKLTAQMIKDTELDISDVHYFKAHA